MKKKLLILTAVLVLLMFVLFVGSSSDEPLSPIAEKNLAFKLPDVAPEDNAFIGLSGLGNPQDGDVVTAGKKYLETPPEFQSGSEEAPKFDFSYKNPCLVSDQGNCLDQIMADASTINAAFEKNKEIIERYYAVQNMPLFMDPSRVISDRIPRYSYLIDVSKLMGAKALLDIKKGGLSSGIDWFESDLNFYKRICQSEQVSLIALMIAVAEFKINFSEVSKIIEDPTIDLAGNEDRLRKMLTVELDTGKMMEVALTMESRMSLEFFNSLPEDWSGEEFGFEGGFKEWLAGLTFKKNMTVNQVAGWYDKNIKEIQAAPVEGFPSFFAQHAARFKEKEMANNSSPTFKELYKKYGVFFFKNYSGELLLNIAQPDYMRYAGRINDTNVFGRLVLAQLELRLMADRPEDISEALAKLGPETFNPYTGKPFEWDREKNVIWAESATKAGTPQDNDQRLEVSVPQPSRR